MLEQDVHDLPVPAGILRHVCVVELNDIDLPRIDLAVQEPLEIVAGELAHGFGLVRTRLAAGSAAHEEFRRGAEPGDLPLLPPLAGMFEHRDQVQVHDADKLPDRCVHENGSPMGRRTQGVRRDEQDRGPGGNAAAAGKLEAVPEVSAPRPQERLGIGNRGQAPGAPA